MYLILTKIRDKYINKRFIDDRSVDRETDRLKNRPTDRQTDKQVHTRTYGCKNNTI